MAPSIEKEAVNKPIDVTRVMGGSKRPPEKAANAVNYKNMTAVQTIQCVEDTGKNLNLSGINVMPFIRVTFFDMDGDGLTDMIAGGKDGQLYFYRNPGDAKLQHWELKDGYFEGISAGAFSSPAIADIDGDGMPEVVVGTGGFSSDSGRLLFFRNYGTMDSPIWKKIEGIDIKVGNDASVAIVDFDFDGKPDVIAGNSEGKIFFFRNATEKGKIRFVEERLPLPKRSFGMYAAPAAVKVNDKVILMIGNSLGRLFMFEIKKHGRHISARELKTSLAAKTFSSPSFADLLEKNRFDMILADGDGSLTYFKNKRNDFHDWDKDREIFNNRILTGPSCTPTVCSIGDKDYMVIGNIDGILRLYEYDYSGLKLPWIEKNNYFKGIKISGFSRGILTQWNGEEMLISGQRNGALRAFIKKGSGNVHTWKEVKGFFRGIPLHEHSTPIVFDIDGDGQWEIITGASDGRIYAYGIKGVKDGLPEWEDIHGMFDNIKVDGFSTPAIAQDMDALYLFVGQQDGRIKTYRAERRDHGILFHDTGFLRGFRVNNHSSPFITAHDGIIKLVSGDYDGNLRHFVCSETVL